jgi:CDP-diacylglycerol--serine O-phosphatidyltransferase
MPAPAGAITVMLPIYAAFLDLGRWPASLTAGYTLLIAFLMVSRLPVFSGKSMRMRVPPELVLPAFVAVIFFIALLISYPWYVLSIGTVLYLASLPLGFKSYRDQARATEAAAPAGGGEVPSPPSAPTLANLAEPPQDDDRPDRLH